MSSNKNLQNMFDLFKCLDDNTLKEYGAIVDADYSCNSHLVRCFKDLYNSSSGIKGTQNSSYGLNQLKSMKKGGQICEEISQYEDKIL